MSGFGLNKMMGHWVEIISQIVALLFPQDFFSFNFNIILARSFLKLRQMEVH